MLPLSFGEYLLNSIVAFVALFSFLFFIPHSLLSSLNDTPLIIYRSLMILAGMLLFLYALLITIYGVSREVDAELRALCFFLDWIYLLFVIPLVVPFVNSMISAAQTASKVLIFEFKKASNRKLSMVPPRSEHENAQTHKYYRILIMSITFITWSACVICQILSWLKDDAFYELILFRYILSAYIAYTALFVAVSFTALYRELNQVQKSFKLYQKKDEQQHKGSIEDLKRKEQNDNSVSVDNSQSPPSINNEVIKNIDQHKRRFMKIIVFVVLLATMSTSSSVSTHLNRSQILAIHYRQHPLFFSEFEYIVHISSLLVFTSIIYLWLAIPNVYLRNVPRDCLGYITYLHCCCRCSCFCCYWCCCSGRIRLFCDKDKMGDEEKKMGDKKKTSVRDLHDDNQLKLPCATQMNIAESDEYADIDLISINNGRTVSKQLSVKVTKSSDNNVAETKETTSKYLDFSRVVSMNLSLNTTRTIGSTDRMRSVDTNNFSAIPTYQSEVHRDLGLMEDDPVYPSYNNNQLKGHPNSVSASVSGLVESDSDDMEGIDDMIIGIKCVVYLFDVLMQNINTIYDYNRKHFELRVRRLTQHFENMEEFELFVLSNSTWSKKMKDILDYLQLRRFFGSKQSGFNIIGYDHQLVKEDKKNIQLMLLHLIKKLEIENDELLFVGNKKIIQLIQTINLCQTYNVDQIYPSFNKKQREEKANGTLKQRDLTFLESQLLSSI